MLLHDKYMTFRIAYKLWTTHVEMTRVVIVDIVNDSPTFMNDLKELLKNQEDTGNSIRGILGDDIANEFIKLLKEHIMIAGDLVKAAKSNSPFVAYEKSKWYSNGDDIARFAVRVNPNLSYDKVRSIFHKHLDITLNEAISQIKGNVSDSLKWYHEALRQILQVADMLSFGLLNQLALHSSHIASLFM